jgi:hypothetical protein
MEFGVIVYRFTGGGKSRNFALDWNFRFDYDLRTENRNRPGPLRYSTCNWVPRDPPVFNVGWTELIQFPGCVSKCMQSNAKWNR